MSKVKFIFLVVFVLVVVALGALVGGNNLLIYIDTPTMVIIPVLPYIISSFIYNFKDQKEINSLIFTTDKNSNIELAKKALDYFTLLKRLSITSAIFGSILGFIGLLNYIDTLETFGRNFAVLLITVFYYSIFILGIVEPLRGLSQKKLTEAE